MGKRVLFQIGWRYFYRHPWQTVLMILGITLGVSVVIAVDLANASARRAFDLSTEAIAGKATHQISGGPQGIDEDLYSALMRQGWAVSMAPVISDYASSAELGQRTFQLLGIDPFAEPPFRNYLGKENPSQPTSPVGASPEHLVEFLTLPGSILISEEIASHYKVSIGQTIALNIGGEIQTVILAGFIQPRDTFSQRALQGIILADLATAQELTGKLGKLDRIDLILPVNSSSSSLINEIQAELPADLTLMPVEARSGAIAQMTSAFQLNLTALSLLALVVGLFLIYNTITFSVVQRRPLFGILRSLGVTRQEVFYLVIIEALLVGMTGALLGTLLGILLGQGTVKLVTQTINDLFFVLDVRGVQIPISSLVKGLLLGVGGTVLSAAPPAWEAASVPASQALSRSGLESKAQSAVRLAAWGASFMILTSLGILAIPSDSLVLSFAGAFAMVVGIAMLVPLFTRISMRTIAPALGKIWGTLGRMAPRNVSNSLSRTSIAVMALMVAVSVTIGVSLMVSSFRATVVTWLGETLQNDIYISAPGLTATTPSIPIKPVVTDLVRELPGVSRIDVLRSVQVDSPNGLIHIDATDNFSIGQERIFLSTTVPENQIWDEMQKGGVIVSEPFSNRFKLAGGDTIEINTTQGLTNFKVIGIYYDYASTQGIVSMALDVYQDLWEDPAITAIGLRLKPGEDIDQVVLAAEQAIAQEQTLIIRPNQALRREVMVIFDRTFAITSGLQLLATLVAFIGVLNALLALALEKQRELGILRSIGMTVAQVRKLVLLETGLMGSVAGLLALPTGYILALILIYIINRRSFGWTLQMQNDPIPFIQAMLIAVTAALLAGLYPALRMAQVSPSEALRSE